MRCRQSKPWHRSRRSLRKDAREVVGDPSAGDVQFGGHGKAGAFASLSTGAKTIQFQLARTMSRKKPMNFAPLDEMAATWQAAIDGLSLRLL